MTFSLTYMSRGNKALTLTVITIILMLAGSVIFIIGPDNSQETGVEVVDDDIFAILPDNMRPDMPAISPRPTLPPILIGTQPPAQAPTTQPPIPAIPPNLFTPTGPIFITTPAPITASPMPVPATPSPAAPTPDTPAPATLPPLTPAPIALDLTQYPFAIAYECDWTGKRLTLTTKTKSASVVRLCIEARQLPGAQEPVEISYLSWFVFERQPYQNQELDHLVQHAVILAKPDPFGLTVMDCHRGAPVCKFATDLRDEFFEVDAFLQGTGELVLQYVRNKQVAGRAPVSIYFLLSATDIKEPLQLGRRAAPVPQGTASSTGPGHSGIRRGRRERNTPLFANQQVDNMHQPP